MKTNRRRFLSLLGVGTAAAPLAAKAALDQAIASEAGLKLTAAAGSLGGIGVGLPQAEQGGTYPFIPYDQRLFKFVALDRQFREQAKWVDRLDIDIASKRSWSMAVKLQEQRQRNYQQQLDRLDYQSKWYKGKSVIEKILGFEWPW